jgi:opacity protein-like surface antigen
MAGGTNSLGAAARMTGNGLGRWQQRHTIVLATIALPARGNEVERPSPIQPLFQVAPEERLRRALSAAGLIAVAMSSTAMAAEPASGFYVRGDFGVAYSLPTLFTDTDNSAANASLAGAGDNINEGSGNSVIYDLGVGYRLSPAVRLDATVGYLPGLAYHGHFAQEPEESDTATVRSILGLINGYLDLAGLAGYKDWPVQPFLVGSAGFASNRLGLSTDVNHLAGFENTFSGAKSTNPAWGLGAGIAIPVGDRLAFEVAYRYLDLGQIRTGTHSTSNGVSTGELTPDHALFTLHTVTAGFRIAF